jgi:hypothetical protein
VVKNTVLGSGVKVMVDALRNVVSGGGIDSVVRIIVVYPVKLKYAVETTSDSVVWVAVWYSVKFWPLRLM